MEGNGTHDRVDGSRGPSESGWRDLTSRAPPDAEEPTRSAGRDAEIPSSCGARGTGSGVIDAPRKYHKPLTNAVSYGQLLTVENGRCAASIYI